ncbi:MAG: glycosyl hydrolase family 18 protein [Salibacteraceae bacterium]
MNPQNKLCNAWIYIGDDAPNGTNYNSPDSAYQRLVKENIYRSVDILFISFVTTFPTGDNTIPLGDGSCYTIGVDESTPNNAGHPGGLTNSYYFDQIIEAAKLNNPGIVVSSTLAWGEASILSNIFNNPTSPPSASDEEKATQFANNLLQFLDAKGLNGFDIDWEAPIASDGINVNQFVLLINAIGKVFQQQENKYYLTLSPSMLGVICDQHNNAATNAINTYVDFLNLQLYGQQQQSCPGQDPAPLNDLFVRAGVDADKLAYGAKFESGYQTASQAYCGLNGFPAYYPNYKVITQWRLNSGNFQFEQENQVELFQLVHNNTPCS